MQVIKTNIMEKYQTLPIMIAEETGENIEYVDKATSDSVWHYSFLDCDSCMKPKSEIAMAWDSKIYQYEQLKDKFKVPQHKIYENVFQVIKDLSWLKKNYNSFMITEEYGVSGESYMYVSGDPKRDIIFKRFHKQGRLRVSKFIPNSISISLHLIVANKDSFYESPLVKQHIENMTLFKGGSYPYTTEYPYITEIDCSIISNALFESGYVGLAHVDFLLADEIYLCEINPRIAGSTPYMSYCLEREYGINLPYLEYYAVKNKSLPKINNRQRCNISWDFRMKSGEKPKGNWIGHLDIRKAFDKSGVYYIPHFSESEYIKLKIDKYII
jgi:predicted ATP-grasp superfamily ATP-dependent carboligase